MLIDLIPLLIGAPSLLPARKTAGYIGIGRWLLPALGTPWHVGPAFQPCEDMNPAQSEGISLNEMSGE